jgi:hypothetical protein
MNSDENFSICRRFGFLHQRVLLYRQDELRALEDRLIRLDDEDAEDDPKLLKSRKLDDVKEGSLRRGLIQEIDEKLEEYGSFATTSTLDLEIQKYMANSSLRCSESNATHEIRIQLQNRHRPKLHVRQQLATQQSPPQQRRNRIYPSQSRYNSHRRRRRAKLVRWLRRRYPFKSTLSIYTSPIYVSGTAEYD